MAELLIKAVSASNADPDKDRSGCYKKGYPVMVKGDGWGWGGEEKLPTFILVKCPEATVAQIEDRMKSWDLTISYAVVAYNINLDGYRMKITSDNVSASGECAVTRSMVETFVNNWGGTIFSVSTNEAVFDIGVYDAIKSKSFWEVDVSDIAFTENSYDTETGIHNIEVDYSGSSYTLKQVNNAITNRKGTNIVNDEENKIATFDIKNTFVREEFKEDIKGKIDKVYCRKQYYFTEAQVNTVINNGGTMTLTAVQLNNAFKNKLDD